MLPQKILRESSKLMSKFDLMYSSAENCLSCSHPQVMQIFFPFSQQIYNQEFPGEHPNDCPRDIKKEE